MPQQLTNGAERLAIAHQQAGEGVAQIVDPQILNFGALAHPEPHPPIPYERTGPLAPDQMFAWLLMVAQLVEDPHRRLGEIQIPMAPAVRFVSRERQYTPSPVDLVPLRCHQLRKARPRQQQQLDQTRKTELQREECFVVLDLLRNSAEFVCCGVAPADGLTV